MVDVTTPTNFWSRERSIIWVTVAILLAATLYFRNTSGIFFHYPDEFKLPIAGPLDRLFKFLAQDLAIGPVQLSTITRAMSATLGAPLDFFGTWLSEGTYVMLPGGSEIELSQLPWLPIAAVLVFLCYWLGGWHPAILAFATLGFSFVFGLWASTMTTLVSVTFAVLFSVIIGLVLGIGASRNAFLSKCLEPFYDALQTIPVFSYLAIILVFFGFGAVTALIATVIFAVAPMAKLTELSLRQIPNSIEELASVTGCTFFQRLFWVQLPTARHGILLGLNQVTMLSLSMVIIASIIGAGGLGNDVLRGLKSLRLAEALLAGLAISFIAITIDRTLRSWSDSSSQARTAHGSRSTTLAFIFGFVALTALSYSVNALHYPPDRGIFDVSSLANKVTSVGTSAGPSILVSARDVFVTWILVPFRDFFTGLPWLPSTLLVGSIGFLFATRAVAVLSTLLLVAIAALGLWDKAMLSLYLVTLSLIVAFSIALPLGLLIGLNKRAYAAMEVVTDVIQTLPSFIYLIPIVVVFGAGDFPALIAIVTYLLAPILRYNAHAIKQVAASGLDEVADMSGCSFWQRLFLVYLPVAKPQLLLGINQALMLGFSMLVITALVGSRGLEETTLVAIAQVKPGIGLLAGLGIAALAIIMDRLLRGLNREVEA